MRKRVLIIEFDQRDAQMMAHTIQQHGYEVLLARSGASGLDLFMNKAPDFVFVNLLMPDLQGAEIINRIRSREEGEKIPIYAINQISGGNPLFSKRMGANGQIDKPVNPMKALSIVRRHIGRNKQREETDPNIKLQGGDSSFESKSEFSKPDKFPSKGSLRHFPFHQMLAHLFRDKETGILQLADDLGKIQISFLDGCPAKVRAGGFLRRLVRDHLVTENDMQTIRHRANSEGVSEEQIIVEMRFLSPEQLEEARRGFAYSIMCDLCHPRRTRFAWKQREVSAGKCLDPAVVIQLAAKSVFPIEKVTKPLESKNRLSKPMYLATDPERLPDLDQHDAISAIVEATKTGSSLRDLIHSSHIPREALLRAAYTLALLKVITFDAAEAWTPPLAVKERKTEKPEIVMTAKRAAQPKRRAQEKAAPKAPREPRKTKPEPEPVEPVTEPLPEGPPDTDSNIALSDDQLVHLGKKFLKEKTFSKAQRCFIELIERGNDNDPHIYRQLAAATFHNRFADPFDRLFDSVDALRKALELDPSYAEARLELARILAEVGHSDLARDELKQQIALTPDHEETQSELRRLERRERRQS